jgi:hypothetical protein
MVQVKTKVPEEKPVAVPLCQTYIPHTHRSPELYMGLYKSKLVTTVRPMARTFLFHSLSKFNMAADSFKHLLVFCIDNDVQKAPSTGANLFLLKFNHPYFKTYVLLFAFNC